MNPGFPSPAPEARGLGKVWVALPTFPEGSSVASLPLLGGKGSQASRWSHLGPVGDEMGTDG